MKQIYWNRIVGNQNLLLQMRVLRMTAAYRALLLRNGFYQDALTHKYLDVEY